MMAATALRRLLPNHLRAISKALDGAGPVIRLAAHTAGHSSPSQSTQPKSIIAELAPEPGGFGEDGGHESGPGGKFFGTLKNIFGWASIAAVGAVGYSAAYYTADEIDKAVGELEQAVKEDKEPSLVSMYLYPGIVSAGHTYVDWRKKFEEYAKGYADPISDKLLPDLGPNLSHVRTLVLDLDGTLVHSDWKRERGWRTFKRPGVDAFLQNMSNYYEIVVFTDQLSSYGEPVLDRLDPQRYYIPYRLYRDATHYKDGEHFRDLTKLNRDLAKVVFISANPKAFALQPENAIRIIPYEMDPKDTALLDLMPFLESAVRQGVPDMRQLLASYKGQNIPEAYRERVKDMQRKMQERGERSFLRRLSGQGPSPPPAQHM